MHVVHDRAVMTLEDAIARVAALLGNAIDWTALDDFLPLGSDPAFRRSALASSFVAALELARQGRVELAQEQAFEPLMLRRVA
jgi:segregation and condensation protein A